MLLMIDIGNTNITLGLYEDNELWHYIRDNGLQAVKRDCSTEVFQSRLYELIS